MYDAAAEAWKWEVRLDEKSTSDITVTCTRSVCRVALQTCTQVLTTKSAHVSAPEKKMLEAQCRCQLAKIMQKTIQAHEDVIVNLELQVDR